MTPAVVRNVQRAHRAIIDQLASLGVSTVAPGDVVVANDDGVVVIPRRLAASVAEKAQARKDNEDDKRKRLAARELGLDMYGMRDALAKAGLVYVDDLDT